MERAPATRARLLYRCRVNSAHTRQSRPDSGLDLQDTVLKTFYAGLSSRGNEEIFINTGTAWVVTFPLPTCHLSCPSDTARGHLRFTLTDLPKKGWLQLKKSRSSIKIIFGGFQLQSTICTNSQGWWLEAADSLQI